MMKQVMLCFMMAFAVAASCADGGAADRRQRELIALEPGLFHDDDEFKHLGDMDSSGNQVEIYFNKCVFGNNRMASRLVLFVSDGTIIQCRVDDEPVVDGADLLFPYEEKRGNRIAIVEKMPDMVYLNGETVSLVKVRHVVNATEEEE